MDYKCGNGFKFITVNDEEAELILFRKILLLPLVFLLSFVLLNHMAEPVEAEDTVFPQEHINPFTNYSENGESAVQLSTLMLYEKAPIMDLQGRGGCNLKLFRHEVSFNWRNLPPNFLYGNSSWIGIPMCVNNKLILDDGRIFDFNTSESSSKIDCGNIIVTCDSNKNVIFSNGVIIHPFSKNTNTEATQKIEYPNGNIIEIKFEYQKYKTYIDNETYGWWCVSQITDSIGRIIKFLREDNNLNYRTTSIIQTLQDGTAKTILSISLDSVYVLTDAANRATKRKLNLIDSGYRITINYPNGVIAEYIISKSSKSNLLKVQKTNLYQSGETTPFKTITYTGTNENSYGFYGNVTVNDGTSVKKYTFTKGYPTIEETYDSSGSVLREKVVKEYQYTTDPRNSKFYYAQPTKISHYPCTSSGTLSSTPDTYTYTYDSYHNVTSITDPYGTKTVMAYANSDCNQKLSTISTSYQDALYTTGVGRHQMIAKATTVTDSVHSTSQLKQTHYKYNSTTGNLEQISEVYNGGYLQTYFTYDSYGNVLTKTDANGNKLCYTYSDKYQYAYLTKIANGSGKTVAQYDYDFDSGNKTMAIDAKGTITYYEYDAINRLTKEYLNNSDSKIGYSRQLAYDDANNTGTEKYGNATAGWQERFITYDSIFGKPILDQRKVNNSWVTQKQYQYDAVGRMAWEKDGLGHQTTYSYDELNRPTAITQPDGSKTTSVYNERTVTTTDANSNSQQQTYDLLGRLTSVKETPDKGSTYYTTNYTYDTFHDDSYNKPVYHLVKTVNPKNAATTNTFDNLGRLVKTVYPQDSTNPMTAESFIYDSVGNLTSKTNGSGTKKLTYEFYGGYRLAKVTEADGKTVAYTYDANDNPLTQTTSGAIYTYTYDVRDRVTNLKAQLDGYSFNVGYNYDTFDRITSIAYPGRSAAVSYNYNELNLLQSIPNFVTSCSYDTDNKLTAMNLANGIANTYSYDQNDRPTKITAGSLLSLSYSYDSVGNITQINNDYYGYDGLNRLTWYGTVPAAQKTSATGTIWAYDGAGNMTAKTDSKGSITFGYDTANRLLKMGSTTYNNNTAGARTEKKATDTWSYTYDGESRLTQVNKNGVTQEQCAYDGAGMRYKKIESGKTTYYIYSGPNPLVEYSPSDGQYTYRIYAGKQAVAEEVDGVVEYYHKDHLASTRIVTSASGKKLAEYKFVPYGEKEIATGTGTAYQFTDKINEGNIALIYFGARFYDPEVGRFISVDPAKDGDNWYAYCYNNPLIFIDPNGKHAVYYSHTDDMIYWVGDHGELIKSWDCSDAFVHGTNENGQARESLPNGDYICNAKTPGKEYGKAYGTFYIDTGDPRGRDIHGGGSGCKDPYADRQGWRPTYGCLRMQNEDGEELSRYIIGHGNNVSLYVRNEVNFRLDTRINYGEWYESTYIYDSLGWSLSDSSYGGWHESTYSYDY